MDRPKFLYHSSENKDVKTFEPQAESIRDYSEGPVVFGTPNKTYCSMFLVKSDDSWTSKGRYEGVWYHAISDENRYRMLDKGGAIYKVPSDTFETDLNKGMKSMEWVSKESVTPISKEIYASGIEAMVRNDVKVIFIAQKIFFDFRDLMKQSRISAAFKLLFSQPTYKL